MHEEALTLSCEELDDAVRGRRAQALHEERFEFVRVNARVLAQLGEQRPHDFVVLVGAVLGAQNT